MQPFETMMTPRDRTVIAADGSDVRVLLSLSRGSMARFDLAPGRTTNAITHQTVDEVWYVIAGEGELWRKQSNLEEVVTLEPGICVTIPQGTHLQFRCTGKESLSIVGVTMPPWPGDSEARIVQEKWSPA